MRSMKKKDATPSRLTMQSDHPVLAFLNTTRVIEATLQDSLQTDAGVLHVLKQLGWPIRFKGTGLLPAARELRETVRRLVEGRKAGTPLHLAPLNKFLGEASSHLELRLHSDGSVAAERVWTQCTAQQALAPLAEAAAELLAVGDFRLVRQCESQTCVLWFYDRTKSHQRRWCSMASCGNRHKMAAFRKRHGEVVPDTR